MNSIAKMLIESGELLCIYRSVPFRLIILDFCRENRFIFSTLRYY
ncbi:hypothetical protein AT1219_20316 [Vibrio alginolyticus]